MIKKRDPGYPGSFWKVLRSDLIAGYFTSFYIVIALSSKSALL
jgi:hypothetical protein